MTVAHEQLESDAVGAFWADGLPGNFVGGSYVPATRRAPVVNPSTGHEFTTVGSTTAAEVDAAIEVAADVQPAWARLTPAQRIDAVVALADRLREWGDRLALLESIDSGNPMFATRRDVGLGLRYLAQWPAQTLARAGRVGIPHADGMSFTTRVPYGVVGKIIAFNHPSLFALAGMIFPLLAGNAMVIKAADQTPLATLALGRIVEGILPDGLVNLVSGGAETGDALVVSPRVKRIAFTGSDTTALRIQSRLSAGGLIKHFSTELGGKNALLIFEDADLDGAIAAAVDGASLTVSQGQSCQATARVLVHRSVHDRVVAGIAARLRTLRVGPSYDEDSSMGPLVSHAQRERVRAFIAGAIADGARLVTGGGVPAHTPEGGFYLEPTLFTEVDSGMRIAQEEIFGPVLVVQPFDTEEEALQRANETRLGLSAAVWTRSLDRAMRVAMNLQAGYVWVNDANRHYPGSPFGGLKASGTGREESLEEYDSFAELRSINVKVPGLLGATPSEA
ncbi:aldehyde dehydrogenase family protein [Propionicicella superfundia]|uniref:aldehyde dehydrogenase family protein n=1 Tax=Propionicicella superfundia TaxID=348582 RepID=UPI000400FE63|nr:aldehyde dehydrogenase family protein [Propionicicella superfundia]